VGAGHALRRRRQELKAVQVLWAAGHQQQVVGRIISRSSGRKELAGWWGVWTKDIFG